MQPSKKLWSKYKIALRRSSIVHWESIGPVEAANKAIMKALKKKWARKRKVIELMQYTLTSRDLAVLSNHVEVNHQRTPFMLAIGTEPMAP